MDTMDADRWLYYVDNSVVDPPTEKQRQHECSKDAVLINLLLSAGAIILWSPQLHVRVLGSGHSFDGASAVGRRRHGRC